MEATMCPHNSAPKINVGKMKKNILKIARKMFST